MKIAFLITRSDTFGGAQMHVLEMADGCRSLGADVSVIVGGSGPYIAALAERNLPYFQVPSLQRDIDPVRDVKAFRALCRLIRNLSPDLLSIHSSKAGVLGRAVGWHLGIPAVFTAHGWSFTRGLPFMSRVVHCAIEHLTSHLATCVINVSNFDRRVGLSVWIARRERMWTVHNGVPDMEVTLRAKPDGVPPRLIMVARFDYPKEQIRLLEALARLPEGCKWTLDLVGDGPMLGKVEEAAQRWVADGRIRFLGLRTDIAALLANAQVFVLVSKFEAFPRTILEAMRAGLPVVASAVGGIHEAVIDGQTGLLFAPDDTESLARKIELLIGDPHLRRRMGEAGRIKYEEEFTLSEVLRRTMKVFDVALEQTRPTQSRLGAFSQGHK